MMDMNDVYFEVTIDTDDDCVCDGCNKEGSAIKIKMPISRYTQESGYSLVTKHITYWYCPECIKKLCDAVDKISRATMDVMEEFCLRCTKHIDNGRLICPECAKLLTAGREFNEVVNEVAAKTGLSHDKAADVLTQYAF